MKFKNICLLLALFSAVLAFSQKRDSLVLRPFDQYPQESIKTDEYGKRYYYDEQQQAKIYEIDGETVVVMDELYLMAKPKFNNQLDRNYYFFLNKKLNRVYPLFVAALQQYRDLEVQLAAMDEAEKRKFARQKQDELAAKYESQLRDLTTTEGQVFAKLMNRATGRTVYDIIKTLRGGWSAFWWNVKGNIADIDLKQEYNPHLYREDEFIESLLQSSWNLGYLTPYPGFKDFQVKK